MCIFCKIVAKEIPSDVVLESDKFLAFKDLHPIAPVHTLVIPKVHIDSFQETPSDIMAEMTPFIQRVTETLGVDKSGYRVITNIGDDGGQEIKHLHFHIVGGAKLKFP